MINFDVTDAAYGRRIEDEVASMKAQGFEVLGTRDTHTSTWGKKSARASAQSAMLDTKYGKNRPKLPICPYGCGEEGQLKEIVMNGDGQAMGIFADSDGCVFTADVQVGEPPTKKKLVLGADGEYHEVSA